ncbi:uncharacterized protein LOC127807403 [Diospyros lotus]|uniref:uncharacterized protein LOC127807403 n=1 Tax=Diospyros lotus TaxID=55363 RepID=UPI0022529F8A|nr:uncharacterized protein LOC127807403 [Diospyros lotus]XP_052201187.1 uncharacterized protein LOC127807403 [Diospyros lotus]
MSRRRNSEPPYTTPTRIPEGTTSQLRIRDFQSVWAAIPSNYGVRYPRRDEPHPCKVGEGSLGIHFASFKAGLRFPLPALIMEWLHFHRIVPAQIHPNGWAQLVGFTILCHQREVVPSLHFLSCFYRLRRSSKRRPFFTLQRMTGLDLFHELPNKINRFESRWFVVDLPPSWDGPRFWRWDDDYDEAIPPPRHVRAVYQNAINKLVSQGPCDLAGLLSLKNIRDAGWGVTQLARQPSSPSTLIEWQNNEGNGEEDTEDLLGTSSHTSTVPQGQPSPKEMDLVREANRQRREEDARSSGKSANPVCPPRGDANSKGAHQLVAPQAQKKTGTSSKRTGTSSHKRQRLREAEAGASVDALDAERSAPSAEALLPGPPPFESIAQDPLRSPSSQGGEAAPSQFAGDLHRSHNECRQPVVPHRMDRRRLREERSLISNPPILPAIGPSLASMQLPDGTQLRGRDFQFCPGVVDTDTVADPGVGARLMYASILPRDERQYFGNFPQTMDEPERKLVEAVQGMVVSNAIGRAYSERMENEVARWRDLQAKWDERHQVLTSQIRRQEQEIEGLRAQMSVARVTSSCLRGENQDLREANKTWEQKFSALQLTHEGLLQEHALRVAELAESRKQALALRTWREEEESATRAEAVKEYRLSKDCQARKSRYASSFTKYGFYLARSYLETQRPEESFPELVLTPEVEEFEAPDWRKYDPDPTSPNTYIRSRLVDDLSNLTGPWEPYSFGPEGDEMIDAHQDLGVAGKDGAEEVPPENAPPTVEQEDGEIPNAHGDVDLAS